ncbi:MAG: hypothetical protein H6509_05985 [Bryobacterales bacterium]|nr:hypothetical protein [Bryobacterales bacterium]
MKLLLILTGILAAVAWLFPDLVILGVFFIVPGMILWAAPTVFLYLTTFYTLQQGLRRQFGVLAVLLAIGGTAVLGWAMVQPARLLETDRFRKAVAAEVTPESPLQLSGVVAIDWQDKAPNRNEPAPCEALCAALLDTPGVEGVVVGPPDARLLVRLGAFSSSGEAVYPLQPGRILDSFDNLEPGQTDRQRTGIERFDERKARKEAVNASWLLRLATSETLTAVPAPDSPPDWTIRRTVERERDEPQVDRLEVLDREGEVRLCRSLVTYKAVALPLHFTLEGGMHNPHFVVARQTLSNLGRYPQFDAEVELLRHVSIPRPSAPDASELALRQSIADALAGPAPTPAQLELGREWLTRREGRQSPEDEALIVRIAETPGIGDLVPLLSRLYPNRAPASFRRGFVARILAPSASDEDRNYYARMLASMPAGTFAAPTPQEVAIWQDPELQRQAAPFLARLADQGPDGLKPLIAVLRETVEIKAWPERRLLAIEICRGLTRMGPDAAPAIDYVRELVRQRPSPVLQSSKDGFAWRVALVRMGLPPEELPFSANLDRAETARQTARILKAAEEYDPDDL